MPLISSNSIRQPIEAKGGNIPRIGSAVLIQKKNKILLGVRDKEPNKGKWVIPGGKILPFEPFTVAAKREVLEETGLDLKIGKLIGIYEIIIPPLEHRIIIYSKAHANGGIPKPSSDIAELRFFTKKELRELSKSGGCTEIVQKVLKDSGWL
jgi:8-oxo-dGTP diphosphatase